MLSTSSTRVEEHLSKPRYLAVLEAADAGALPLMLSVDGALAEGSTYNIFLVAFCADIDH